MGRERADWGFMDTWLDSPYIYDIYDPNDGDSMTIITKVRYEGIHLKYLYASISAFISDLCHNFLIISIISVIDVRGI